MQFLWRLKMLPFGCRGEKWLFLVRKRQFQVTPTEMAAEDFHYLARLHNSHRPVAGPAHVQQQRMIDLVRCVSNCVQYSQLKPQAHSCVPLSFLRTLSGRFSSSKPR